LLTSAQTKARLQAGTLLIPANRWRCFRSEHIVVAVVSFLYSGVRNRDVVE
jgi:hypothetical protein